MIALDYEERRPQRPPWWRRWWLSFIWPFIHPLDPGGASRAWDRLTPRELAELRAQLDELELQQQKELRE